jgi:hypothetical protein
MPLINPLTQDHTEAIQRVLRSINDIQDTIKACTECGLSMEEEQAVLDAQRTFAEKVKHIFMRHEP